MGKYKAFEKHRIPYEFEYTERLVHFLMMIAETKPYIEENLAKPLEVQLLRQAKIRAITFSNQIEGNPLGERGVTQALEGKHEHEGDNAVKEVRNYGDALDYAIRIAKAKRRLTTKDLCDIQKLITSGVLSDKHVGVIRNISVSIGDASTGVQLDSCPEPKYLEDLLEDLWEWVEDHHDANAFALAFAFHYLFIAIHPFADGNGRTVRIMQHLLLLRSGESIAQFVPSESVIMATRSEYYSTIRQCKILGTLNPFLEYLAECFALAAENVVYERKTLLLQSAHRKPEARREKIVSIGMQRKAFTIQDVIEALPDIPRRTLERDLEYLVKEGKLQAKGETRARVYTNVE
ncbi:MAG: Fic family protein [Bdellovibrionaceae bacterium]|nr:Fic family protein [Bdellovibrionales bacterium]MCB9085823.1 Fic family protein [Pseudobdellovibrionaceae bacterium]